MNTRFVDPDALRALIVSLAGGSLCYLISTPIPWMLGSLLAMGAGKLAGLDLRAPWGARQAGQTVIAAALGLYFTPAVAQQVLAYGPLMVFAAIFAIILGYVGALALAALTGTDRTTAFFASVPGGATEMAILGDLFGAAIAKVALAQSLRITLVVLTLPFALALLHIHGADLYQPAQLTIDYGGLVLLVGLAAGGGMALFLLRVPNAWMLGPLFVTIALTVAEVHLSAIPPLLSNAGQLLIGCTLGSRFDRGFMLSAPRFVAGAVASILLALAISALFAAGIARLAHLGVPTLVLATAPGGIAEMCITAKALKLGVPLVTGFHVTRVILLVTGTAPLFRLVRRWRGQ